MLASEPNGAIWDGLFGAVIGAVIAGGMSVCVLAFQLSSGQAAARNRPGRGA